MSHSAPGPRIGSSAFMQFLRGMCMGGADVIPGVSGGTVALILGIYERLIAAISHVDVAFLKHLMRRDWRAAARHIDFWFVLPLGLGIGTGIVALGSLMHHLLEHHLQFTLAAFFGMIAASCLLVGRLVLRWGLREVLLFIAGAGVALWIVRQSALTNPPDELWYVFLCGTIGICAMILPGISGAFILLIMGKYHDLTGIIKQTLHLELSVASVTTVIVFGCGCVVGLLTFSRILRWLLSRHGSATMAVLCGFMAGSLWRIYPFQVDTTPDVEEFKYKVFQPAPLNTLTLDTRFWLTMGIVILSAVLVLALDRIAQPAAEHVVDEPGTLEDGVS